ncbi:MAG: T9SS type A sorting domain-containing protein [Flavobacteriaceae bacterium]|nr:T9SS type A sorting domain-containing protein [Flavobacteriaceae bacterium]
MKKIYVLLFLLLNFTVGAQTPILTAIVDGDCSGGTPKMLEIYANGTVDFSNFALENQTNVGTTWGVNTSLSSFGIVTDDFVYVTSVADLTILNQEFPSTVGKQVLVSSVINLNGDDRIRIVQGTTVIDQFGVDGLDGSGTTWETTDSYAKRLDGTSPDGGFTEVNWNIPGPASLDLQGICQGGTAFETLMGGIGTFSPSASTDPTISISSPGNGSTIPPTSSFNVTFSVQNFAVATPSAGDGFINYIVDGGTTVDKFDTTPISLTLGAGTHTVDMELVDNAGAPLSPTATASVSFTIATLNPIADIATLRAQPTGATNFYQLTGEATVTFAVAARNQIFIQDATAGILIDDASNTIATAYAQGDGMTGLKGTLNLFNGIFQFLPIENPGTPSSTGNTVTPKVITLAELNTNFDAYESQIVKIAGVTIDPTNVTFTTAPATNYAINVGADVSVLRTQHPESGLQGVTIPVTPIDVYGIVSEFTAASQLFPFYDFVNTPPPALLSTEDFGINSGSFKVYPNPVSTGIVNIVSAQNGSKTVVVFDILGKQMLRTQLNGTTLDVSQLNNGIYILKIEENGKTTSKKLIVQK